MNADDLADYLSRVEACPEARHHCDGKTLREAWMTCESIEWLHWILISADPTACLWCECREDDKYAHFKTPEAFDEVERMLTAHYEQIVKNATTDPAATCN